MKKITHLNNPIKKRKTCTTLYKSLLLIVSCILLTSCDSSNLPGFGIPGPGGGGGLCFGRWCTPGPPVITPGGTQLPSWELPDAESSVPFDVASSTLRRFIGKAITFEEDSLFINISLSTRGTVDCHGGWTHNRYLYGGQVTIGGKVKGKKQYKSNEFHSDQSSRHTVAGEGDSGPDSSNRYNYVFKNPDHYYIDNAHPQTVWQGFFEDHKGGLVVIVYPGPPIERPEGPPRAGPIQGEVWYKNFQNPRSNSWSNWWTQRRGPNPPTPCWFVSLGPYDCRAFVERGQEHITTPGRRAGPKYKGKYSAVYPSGWGYNKLGSFEGLNVIAAFGGNDPFDDDQCGEARRLNTAMNTKKMGPPPAGASPVGDKNLKARNLASTKGGAKSTAKSSSKTKQKSSTTNSSQKSKKTTAATKATAKKTKRTPQSKTFKKPKNWSPLR